MTPWPGRQEDRRLVAGRGRYVANVGGRRTAHMKVVRSPHARARIRAIDTSAARAMDGVLAVWTGEDVRDRTMPVSGLLAHLVVTARQPLAHGHVSHVGEPVAVVVATDPARAEDALERVEVDYEPLTPVLDVEAAQLEQSPLVHPALATNVAYVIPTGPRLQFADSDVVVRQRIVHQRLMASSMEPRGVLADYDTFDHRLTAAPLHTGTPRAADEGRRGAGDAGRARPRRRRRRGRRVRLEVQRVPRGDPRQPAVAPPRRPVRWIEERTESACSSPHGRAIVADVELAATTQGVLTGLHVRMVGDLGAHVGVVPPTGSLLACQMVSGAYQIPAISYEAVGVFTNKVPVDPYCGYYHAEATHTLERAMDLLARELDIDPVDLRRRNLVPREAMPFTTATGEAYDSGDYGCPVPIPMRSKPGLSIQSQPKRCSSASSPIERSCCFPVMSTTGRRRR